MTRKQIYQRSLNAYGYLTLLYLLNIQKSQENYEDCAMILSLIKELSDKHDLDLPTELSNEAIIDMKITLLLHFGLSGDLLERNIPYYAEKIQEELKMAL